MKKVTRVAILLALTVCSFALSNNADAQVVTKGSSNFFIGYGYPNIPKLLVGGLWENGSGASGVGPYTICYQYGIANKLALGGQIGYVSGTSGPISWDDQNAFGGSNTYHYTFSMSIFPAMAKLDYHYLKSKSFDLYSGVALGYGLARISFTGLDNPDGASVSGGGFIYSVNGIGMRWMIFDHVGLFSEFGYGAMGLVTVGFSAKWGGPKRGWLQ